MEALCKMLEETDIINNNALQSEKEIPPINIPKTLPPAKTECHQNLLHGETIEDENKEKKMWNFDWFTKMNYLENQVQKQIDSKNTMTISHLHEFTENEIKKTHDRMKDTRLEEFKSNKQHKDDILIALGFFINKEDIKKTLF